MHVFAILIALAMQIAAQQQPAQILLIAREPLKPGHEVAYWKIEEDTARLSVKLGCPHPYLAAETLTGPKEIWWFNGFASLADNTRVADDYARNLRWTEALE